MTLIDSNSKEYKEMMKKAEEKFKASEMWCGIEHE